MNVSSVSLSNSLAAQATSLQASNFGLKLSTTILKNIMDSQEQQGQALVEMIRQTPSASGTGSIVDIRA